MRISTADFLRWLGLEDDVKCVRDALGLGEQREAGFPDGYVPVVESVGGGDTCASFDVPRRPRQRSASLANSCRTLLDEVLTGRGISTKSLARLAQVSPGTVRGWRDGTTVPSLTCGRRAAAVLGMTLDEFADLCERDLIDVR